MKPRLNREKQLETILVICIGLVVVYFITRQQYRWLLTISVIVGIAALASKFLASKITWAWMKLGEMMGWVMSKVILSIIFFGFLFPIALLSKMFSKKDSLHLKRTAGPTYWFVRNHKYTARDMENTW